MNEAPPLFRAACHAMATRFEVVLWGGTETHLLAAAEQAFDEIRRLEAQLSFHRASSDIADLNRRAAYEPVIVEPRLFRLLERAKALSAETSGAFDITIAPLLRAWGFVGASGWMPDESEVAAARAVTGMDLVELDAESLTVRFRREGVMLDLGAIGKGYAIECAAEILRDAGIEGGLIHGGTSTVQPVGPQPDGSPWPVAIHNPLDAAEQITLVRLLDRALSVSAAHGKSFSQDDVRYGHVLDPRSGRPAQAALLAAVLCPSATDSDALSTALLIDPESLLPKLVARPEPTGGLVVVQQPNGKLDVRSAGL